MSFAAPLVGGNTYSSLYEVVSSEAVFSQAWLLRHKSSEGTTGLEYQGEWWRGEREKNCAIEKRFYHVSPMQNERSKNLYWPTGGFITNLFNSIAALITHTV